MSAPAEPRPPRILLADDDATLRMILGEILRNAGFEVLEAEDGLDAVEKLDGFRPDLVVLDVLMPRLDGFEACARIRLRPDGALLPILVATGLEEPGAVDRAFEAGATDFITKPVQGRVFEQRIRYMLRGAGTIDALARSERLLAQAQRVASLGYFERDLSSGAESASAGTYHLLGADPADTRPVVEVMLERLHAGDRELLRRSIDTALAAGTRFHHDVRFGESDPQRHLSIEGRVAGGESGRAERLTVTLQDVTERKLAEERIRFLAYYDALTRLPNRQLFLDRVSRELPVARRTGRPLAVLFLDLDRFKRVNDTLGHRFGDLLLVEVGERLRRSVRSTDDVARAEGEAEMVSVARLGGDEFILCLRDMAHPEDAAVVAQRILRVLAEPIVLEGHEIDVTASVGIAVFPADGDDVDTLLKHADTAMYRAKAEQAGSYRFYDPAMSATALRRLAMEADLRRALGADEFEVHFQPQVDTTTRRLVGFEALIRWNHGVLGLIPPSEFIPIAEECGIIGRIGEWMLESVCSILSSWKRDGLSVVPVAVNVSARSFELGPFVESVESALARHDLPPSSLEVEITEAVLMRGGAETIDKLERLRASGVRVAIDDFGTGYSSLAYLKQLPVDRLKIDRSLVCDLTREARDRAIASAILTMGRGLGIDVVAEGVEEEAQREILETLGCPVCQGWLFGRPENREAAAARLMASAKA